MAVADLGEVPGGLRPPLFLDQTEAQRAEKNLFGDPPPPYLRVWMTRPPPATVWGTLVEQMPFTNSIIPE